MKTNMGTIDKTIRLSLALLVVVLYFTKVLSGTWAIVLGSLAVVFAVTSFMSFCPLYIPFRINTARKKK